MSDPQNSPMDTEINIEDAIAQLEANLSKLKERHQQILKDQAQKIALIERRQELKMEQNQGNSPDSLKSELHYIEKELEEIELRLESELFKWSSLSEPFWQGVRFLGMGIVLGWILKTMTLS